MKWPKRLTIYGKPIQVHLCTQRKIRELKKVYELGKAKEFYGVTTVDYADRKPSSYSIYVWKSPVIQERWLTLAHELFHVVWWEAGKKGMGEHIIAKLEEPWYALLRDNFGFG